VYVNVPERQTSSRQRAEEGGKQGGQGWLYGDWGSSSKMAGYLKAWSCSNTGLGTGRHGAAAIQGWVLEGMEQQKDRAGFWKAWNSRKTGMAV